MTAPSNFPPLQATIAYAETWRTCLNACQDELHGPEAADVVAKAENVIGIGVQLGELLPITWRAAFDCILRPDLSPWKTVKDFESFRQALRALFYTVREAMDSARKTAEAFQSLTGRQPAGMDRLLKAIEEARELEVKVF